MWGSVWGGRGRVEGGQGGMMEGSVHVGEGGGGAWRGGGGGGHAFFAPSCLVPQCLSLCPLQPCHPPPPPA